MSPNPRILLIVFFAAVLVATGLAIFAWAGDDDPQELHQLDGIEEELMAPLHNEQN